MLGLFNFTINSKEDLRFISKDSKIENLFINYNCKLCVFLGGRHE